MDICHLKNAELETKHQKYKGRVVLRGDIVKDVSKTSQDHESNHSSIGSHRKRCQTNMECASLGAWGLLLFEN